LYVTERILPFSPDPIASTPKKKPPSEFVDSLRFAAVWATITVSVCIPILLIDHFYPTYPRTYESFDPEPYYTDLANCPRELASKTFWFNTLTEKCQKSIQNLATYYVAPFMKQYVTNVTSYVERGFPNALLEFIEKSLEQNCPKMTISPKCLAEIYHSRVL